MVPSQQRTIEGETVLVRLILRQNRIGCGLILQHPAALVTANFIASQSAVAPKIHAVAHVAAAPQARRTQPFRTD